GGDDHVGPELGAVLADPPALVLDPPRGGRLAEQPLRLAGGDVLLRVEHREVLADDVGPGVALQPLGTAVPAHDGAVRIDEEEGVLLHAVDQQAEALVGLLQLTAGVALPLVEPYAL